MLEHVPFGNETLLAVLTFEWLDSTVFAEVYFKITLSIVFFIAAFVVAHILVYIIMCLDMVPQDPLLPKLSFAVRISALEPDNVFFVVGGHVVGQMLWHFKLLPASLESAVMLSFCGMVSHVLPKN